MKPNKWVSFATVLLEERFPRPPHDYRLEMPTTKFRDNTSIRADIGIYEGQTLRAVVEVGDLSQEGKLEAFESAFPDAQVIWVPKTELLMLAAPELKRFRLIRDGDGVTSLEFAIRNITRERYEMEKLRELLNQRLAVAREMMGSGIKAVRNIAQAIGEYALALDALDIAFSDDSNNLSSALINDVSETSSDKLLDAAQSQATLQQIKARLP